MNTLNRKDLELLRKCINNPSPCIGCDEPWYHTNGECHCSKQERWDLTYKEDLDKPHLFFLYPILVELHNNRKEFNELLAKLINELDDDTQYISELLDMV